VNKISTKTIIDFYIVRKPTHSGDWMCNHDPCWSGSPGNRVTEVTRQSLHCNYLIHHILGHGQKQTPGARAQVLNRDNVKMNIIL